MSQERAQSSDELMPPPTSKLRKSRSTSSITSLLAECDLGEYSVTDIIGLGLSTIRGMIESAQSRQLLKQEKKCKTIKRVLKELERREESKQAEAEGMSHHIADLEGKLERYEESFAALKKELNHLKNGIAIMLEQLSTIQYMQAIIQKISEETTNDKSENHNHPHQEASGESASVPNSAPESSPKPRSTTRDRSHSPEPDRPHLRTLIVKGAGTRITNKEIQSLFTQAKYTTAHPIDKVLNRQYHLEIIC